jgi:arylsulfatase
VGAANDWIKRQHAAKLLDLLGQLGIANDIFVMYSTDNGPHMNSWPDGAMTPFRSEKNTNWEAPSASRCSSAN